MFTLMELRARGIIPYPRTNPSANPPNAFVMSTATSAVAANPPSMTHPATPKRTNIPEQYMRLEPREPLIVIDDNPVFNSFAAGRIIGCSYECLKKWRQRNQGPDYIQYGQNGTVRYELSALMTFRAQHRVNTVAKA